MCFLHRREVVSILLFAVTGLVAGVRDSRELCVSFLDASSVFSLSFSSARTNCNVSTGKASDDAQSFVIRESSRQFRFAEVKLRADHGVVSLFVEGIKALTMSVSLTSAVVECLLCDFVFSPVAGASTGRLTTPPYDFSVNDDDREKIAQHSDVAMLPGHFLFHSRRLSLGFIVDGGELEDVKVVRTGGSRWRVELKVIGNDTKFFVLPGPTSKLVTKQMVRLRPRRPLELWVWDPTISLRSDGAFDFSERHDEAVDVADLLLRHASAQYGPYATGKLRHFLNQKLDETLQVVNRFDRDLESYTGQAIASTRADTSHPVAMDQNAVVTSYSLVGPFAANTHVLIPIRTALSAKIDERVKAAVNFATEQAQANAILALHRPSEVQVLRDKLLNQTRTALVEARSIDWSTVASSDALGQWWEGLKTVVPLLLSLALFGEQYSGVDPSGIAGPPPCDAELLVRLFQLVTLLPFSRYPAHCVDLGGVIRRRGTAVSTFEYLLFEHNRAPIDDGIPPFTGLLAVRTSLRFRQRISPYLISEATLAFLDDLTLMRPLFDDWQLHPLWPSRSQSFMLGRGLVVRPITEQTPLRVLLSTPDSGERWYSFATGVESTSNVIETMVAADFAIGVPMALRGGHVLALAQMRKTSAVATVRDPLQLLVSLDVHNESAGFIFTDDGTDAVVGSGNYLFTEVRFEEETLRINPLPGCPNSNGKCVPRMWKERREVNNIILNGIAPTRLRRLKKVSMRINSTRPTIHEVNLIHRVVNGRTLKLERVPAVLDGVSGYTITLDFGIDLSKLVARK